MSAAEVIQEWADADSGWSFERGRMQTAVRSLCFDQPAVLPPALAAAGAVKGKKEDVTFLVEELMLTRSQAERALAKAGGDVTKAIQALVLPPQVQEQQR